VPIRTSFDADSKVTDETKSHPEKHSSARISTDAGIEIDCNFDKQSKMCASIRASLDPDSNVIDESELHSRKQSCPMISTDAGIEIDFKFERRANA
jgi:hypothetical protein